MNSFKDWYTSKKVSYDKSYDSNEHTEKLIEKYKNEYKQKILDNKEFYENKIKLSIERGATRTEPFEKIEHIMGVCTSEIIDMGR
jgi:hypothetical protein